MSIYDPDGLPIATFLAELAKSGRVAYAAKAAGLDRSSVYKAAKANPEFAQRWEDAEKAYVDVLVREAHRRAVEGVEEAVWYQGNECGKVRKYSDSLLTTMLKAAAPAEFRENATVKIGNDNDGAFRVEESPTATARKIAFALALGMRAQATKENAASVDGAPSAGHPDDGSDLV
jgi:hypothetical protein